MLSSSSSSWSSLVLSYYQSSGSNPASNRGGRLAGDAGGWDCRHDGPLWNQPATSADGGGEAVATRTHLPRTPSPPHPRSPPRPPAAACKLTHTHTHTHLPYSFSSNLDQSVCSVTKGNGGMGQAWAAWAQKYHQSTRKAHAKVLQFLAVP